MILFTLGAILLSCPERTYKAYAEGYFFARVRTDKALHVEMSKGRHSCLPHDGRVQTTGRVKAIHGELLTGHAPFYAITDRQTQPPWCIWELGAGWSGPLHLAGQYREPV